jgi:hypothetical protein
MELLLEHWSVAARLSQQQLLAHAQGHATDARPLNCPNGKVESEINTNTSGHFQLAARRPWRLGQHPSPTVQILFQNGAEQSVVYVTQVIQVVNPSALAAGVRRGTNAAKGGCLQRHGWVSVINVTGGGNV